MSGVGVSPYKYSDAAVFGSEAIAMCFTIYIGKFDSVHTIVQKLAHAAPSKFSLPKPYKLCVHLQVKPS